LRLLASRSDQYSNSECPAWVVKDVQLQHGKTMVHIIVYLLGKSCKKMKLNVLVGQERKKKMKSENSQECEKKTKTH
jgi:hypothetical protein